MCWGNSSRILRYAVRLVLCVCLWVSDQAGKMKTVRVGMDVAWADCSAQVTALSISVSSYSGLASEVPVHCLL